MKHETKHIIEAFRAWDKADEIKLLEIAADRLEELQRELTDTILERYKTVAELIKQRDEANAEVERLKQQLANAPQIRPDPSRLEIAAMLMAACYANPEANNYATDKKWWIEQADALIAAAAREAK